MYSTLISSQNEPLAMATRQVDSENRAFRTQRQVYYMLTETCVSTRGAKLEGWRGSWRHHSRDSFIVAEEPRAAWRTWVQTKRRRLKSLRLVLPTASIYSDVRRTFSFGRFSKCLSCSARGLKRPLSVLWFIWPITRLFIVTPTTSVVISSSSFCVRAERK